MKGDPKMILSLSRDVPTGQVREELPSINDSPFLDVKSCLSAVMFEFDFLA